MINYVRFLLFIFIIVLSLNLKASEASNWLKQEVDKILIAYQDPNLPNENRFLLIEQTINNNFPGKSIAINIAKQSYKNANEETRKNYIDLFKRHLALNIASLMKGYSNQKYELTDSRYDEKNKVNYIDMKVYLDTGEMIVTWRVLKHKERYFVIDLIISGISLYETKRSEFNSMLKNVDNNLIKLNEELQIINESSYQKIIN
ncbi:ABC transporter substrate-binding protein [Pelagibacteraceae bacterium]|nr:ABC transporter substrate-binding protein [Pelagibacteraceae bacterium]